MRQELSFNGRALSDFGVWFDGSVSFGSPERDVELVEVFGRDGALSISNDRFRNIEITFPCAIRSNFISNYRSLMAFLNSSKGYCRMETTQEPNYYRLALFMNQTDPTGYKLNTHGRFDLVFQVMPQRFLKSGETSVEVTTTLENPTLFPSKPIIRVYGNGTLNINDIYITVASSPYEYVDIDCELMDCYYGSNNANQYVSFSTTDFVTLQSGTNSFAIDGFTSVEVTPRWYEV
jgi:phage-related protein